MKRWRNEKIATPSERSASTRQFWIFGCIFAVECVPNGKWFRTILDRVVERVQRKRIFRPFGNFPAELIKESVIDAFGKVVPDRQPLVLLEIVNVTCVRNVTNVLMLVERHRVFVVSVEQRHPSLSSRSAIPERRGSRSEFVPESRHCAFDTLRLALVEHESVRFESLARFLAHANHCRVAFFLAKRICIRHCILAAIINLTETAVECVRCGDDKRSRLTTVKRAIFIQGLKSDLLVIFSIEIDSTDFSVENYFCL